MCEQEEFNAARKREGVAVGARCPLLTAEVRNHLQTCLLTVELLAALDLPSEAYRCAQRLKRAVHLLVDGLMGNDEPGSNHEECAVYRRQNCGVKRTSRDMTSSRPSTMVNAQIQVWRSLNGMKLPAGPSSFRPGPMLLMQAITAAKAVTMSSPEAMRANVIPMIEPPYSSMKASID